METISRAATTMAERAATGSERAGPINRPRDQVASDAHGVRRVARIKKEMGLVSAEVPKLTVRPSQGATSYGRFWHITPLHRLIDLMARIEGGQDANEGLWKIRMRGCL